MTVYLSSDHYLPPCMGGWCAKREHCARYRQQPAPGLREPAERLCEAGKANAFRALVAPHETPLEAA